MSSLGSDEEVDQKQHKNKRKHDRLDKTKKEMNKTKETTEKRNIITGANKDDKVTL